jgi:flagellar protein FlaG
MIMITEINADNISSVTTTPETAVKKVDPVGMTKSLPDGGPYGGNQLPVTENKTESPTNIDDNNIDNAVRELNEHLQIEQRELQFTIDKDSGHTVIKVIDIQTKEIIRQIPNEEAIKVAQRLSEGSNLEIFDEYI